jgi:hypothetical protein
VLKQINKAFFRKNNSSLLAFLPPFVCFYLKPLHQIVSCNRNISAIIVLIRRLTEKAEKLRLSILREWKTSLSRQFSFLTLFGQLLIIISDTIVIYPFSFPSHTTLLIQPYLLFNNKTVSIP